KLAASAEPAKEAAAKLDKALGTAAKDRAALAAEHAKATAALATVLKTIDPLIAAMNAAQQQVAAKQDAVTAVNEALARTQEAVKKLPADKELADIVAKLQAKGMQLGTELATLKKSLDAASATVKTAQEKLVAPKKVVDEWAAKLAAADTSVEAAR